MWSCSRYPDCLGAVNIDPIEVPSGEAKPIRVGAPGVYAQQRFEQERNRERLKRRAILPLTIALGLLGMAVVFFGFMTFGVAIASISAVIAGFLVMLMIFRLPADSLMWAKGVEGEQKTAEFLEPLLNAGFVILFGRAIPGGKSDIDSIVIGPSGVFPIETKSWKGKVEVRGDRLYVGEHDRSWVIDQIYREALAVQVALGDELTRHRVTVTPILCAITGVTGAREARGVQISDGRRLARLIAEKPTVFDDETVQRVARLADSRLRLPYEWELE
jgi:hypothetical protein